MFETALAQLRLAASLLFAVPFNTRSLDRLVEGMRQTRDEFGMLSQQANEFVNGPILDEQTRAEMQLGRFRKQAVRAAHDTPYYAELFRKWGEDPSRLTHKSLLKLPLTSKDALREDGDAFVRRSARPLYRMLTTGTTGKPTAIWFSAREMQAFYAFSAMGYLMRNLVDSQDIVQVTTSSRAMLGNMCFMEGCTRVGAAVYQTGLLEPQEILAQLAAKRNLPGKRPKASVLFTYPSFLGHLVSRGLGHGFRSADFSIEKIALGGEIVTEGVKSRAQELFGPVEFIEAYGITESWPQGGDMCNEGHLHFEPSQGLMEVIGLNGDQPTQPGDPGTLVLTPFPPFRETTILLRYDTEDVVRAVQGPLTCSHRHIPAVSRILGKLKLSVRHDRGWTFPRQILEALEAVRAIPLPARCRFWAVPGGVAVEVFTRQITPAVHANVAASLESHGVALQELFLRSEPEGLHTTLPRRGDLRELGFATYTVPDV
jgi:phenylacetate-CoA ligase